MLSIEALKVLKKRSESADRFLNQKAWRGEIKHDEQIIVLLFTGPDFGEELLRVQLSTIDIRETFLAVQCGELGLHQPNEKLFVTLTQ
ncbi:MAG TPA: hypothetical protein VF088_21425 [Pyrinomonadaceae bacterium]